MKKLLFLLSILAAKSCFCSVNNLCDFLRGAAEKTGDVIANILYVGNPSAELEIAKKLVDIKIGYFSGVSAEKYNIMIADMYQQIQSCKYSGYHSNDCKIMAVKMSRFAFSDEGITKHSKRTAAQILRGK